MKSAPNARQSGRVDLKTADINIPGVVAIGSYHYRSARKGLENVHHPGCMGICHLAKGSQTYRVNNQTYHLRGGDQLITLPGEVLDTAGTPEEIGQLYWFIFKATPSNNPLLFLDRSSAQTLRRTIQQLPRRHFPALAGADEVAGTILNMLSVRPQSHFQRLHLAHFIQRYLFLTHAAARANTQTGPSPRIQRCLDYIARHLEQPLPVAQLADCVNLSESRFKNRFRQEVGTSPGDYVLRTKISAAQTALRSRHVPITDLAHELGFSSSQYFATVFRRFTDTTPSDYRFKETKSKT